MVTRILPPSDELLTLAADALRNGDLVAIPTETVYGLAGSAVDERAVAAIFAARDRPTFDPLIVHVATPHGWDSWDAAERFERVAEEGIFVTRALGPSARERAGRLMHAFWPGPLTLVLSRAPRIPLLVTSGLDTVAVRMPRHLMTQALLSRAGVPLAAPSANRFGRISPTTAGDVLAELRGRIPFILDGGPSEVRPRIDDRRDRRRRGDDAPPTGRGSSREDRSARTECRSAAPGRRPDRRRCG